MSKSWGDEFLDDLEEIAHEQAERLRAERDEQQTNGQQQTNGHEQPARLVRATPASQIVIARTRWLWDQRLAAGTFALLAGREGLGKSTVGYWLAARITRGELPGEYEGTPRGVLICATEDTYAEVIVPRLIAAGADLDRVFRVDVVTTNGGTTELVLPVDLADVGRLAIEHDAALLLLDPLISRLGRADTHRDSETRGALEPLSALAEACSMAVLGLIHHNKSTSADVLTQIMGSRAFTAVARSVHTVIEDPDDDTRTQLLFGTVKNNLGPSTTLPTLTFTIEAVPVGHDLLDGSVITGTVVRWGDDAVTSIAEAFAAARDVSTGGQMAEAVSLLRSMLDHGGGCVASKDAQAAGRSEGISERTMKRAAQRMSLLIESSGFPRRTTWTDPASVSKP